MKHIKIAIIISIIILTNTNTVFTQSMPEVRYGIPSTEHYNRRQYRGGTQNWKITQAKNEIIYFANNDGVLEYNGVNWQILNHNTPISVRSVKAINNRLYIGAYNEFGYFCYDSLYHFRYTSLSTTQELKSLTECWTILDWQDKIVFHSEKAICIFKDDKLIKKISATSRFTSIYKVNGLLLVHDETEGLLEIRGNNIYKVHDGNIFKNKIITSIMDISDNKIIIGTMTHGLYLWDMQEIVKWNVSADDLLASNNIFCGTKYFDKYLIFGTIQSGLIITDFKGNIILVIDKDKGLKNNTVLSVLVDREGIVWCGLDNGITKVNLHSPISFLQSYFNIGTGYYIKRFKSNYYFGTNQALYRISEKKFKDPLKTRDDFIKIPGTSGQIWTLFDDGENLLCGHNLGVFEIKSQGAKLITPPVVNGVWIFKKIKNNPDMLIAGTYNGLILLHKHNGRWEFKSIMKGFKESSRFIEWDKNNDLWISHGYTGVFKISLSSDYSNVTKVDTFAFSDFPDNNSPLVVSKIKNELFFVSNNGIYKLNSDQTRPIKAIGFQILYDNGNYPSRLIEDQFRNIWYFYNNKIGVLRYMEDGSYKKIDYPFTSLNNKLVNNFEFVFIPNEENVFFGVEDGFAHYLVGIQKNYKTPFNVHINYFKGRTDSVAYSTESINGKFFQKFIPQYKFKDNTFEIHYAASYYESNNILYSTILEGYENTPSTWSTTTTREFSRLPEGNYKFIVKAKNIYGVEAKPVSIEFEVLPPLYRTFTAKLIYGALFILFSFLFYKIIDYRIKVSRRKEKIKQQMQFKSREEQLKNEALMAEKEMIHQRNERLRSSIIYKEKELANSTMHIIHKKEILSYIKDQLKKLKNLDSKEEIERKINNIIRKINKDSDNEDHWRIFETHLEQVHEDFLKRLKEKHPDLNSKDLKLCAYIRMNMSSKEIATLMNISFRTVENNRYHLRKKLCLGNGVNLSSYITNL